jgi:hypothetical protein
MPVLPAGLSLITEVAAATDFELPTTGTCQFDATSTVEDYDQGPDIIDASLPSLNPLVEQADIQQRLQGISPEALEYLGESQYQICSDIVALPTDAIQTSQQATQAVDLLSEGTAKKRLSFKNPLDLYALTGETCRKFEGDVCSEEKDTDGNPVHYDEVWENDLWDAPKADARILSYIAYMITPIEKGGAGREIKVEKIIDTKDYTDEFAPRNAEGDLDASDLEETTQRSGHAYDQENPSNPRYLSRAVDISEVDSIRITTRIIEKKRFGGNKTKWKYQKIPIKLAYQTNAGQEKVGVPSLNIYDGSRLAVTDAILGALADLDLGVTIDPKDVRLDSLDSIASLVGNAALGSVLQTGSLTADDLEETLEQYGRQALAIQLNLPQDALIGADTVDDLVQNVGRRTLETQLGLSSGSLRGSTSTEIFQSVGIRRMEVLLGVAPDTLRAENGAPASLANRDALLERVGRGTIAQTLSIPIELIREVKTLDEARAKSTKMKIFFAAEDTRREYLDETFGISGYDRPDPQWSQYIQRTYGIVPDEATKNATKQLTDSAGDVTSWTNYLRLVGALQVDKNIGGFSAATAQVFTTTVTSPINPDTKLYQTISAPRITNEQCTRYAVLVENPASLAAQGAVEPEYQDPARHLCVAGKPGVADRPFAQLFLASFGISPIRETTNPGSSNQRFSALLWDPTEALSTSTTLYADSRESLTATLLASLDQNPRAQLLIGKLQPFARKGGNQQAQLRQLVERALSASSTNDYVPFTDDPSLVRTLANRLKTDWADPISTITNSLNAYELVRPLIGTESDSDGQLVPTDDGSLNAGFLSDLETAAAAVDGLHESLNILLREKGQTGRGAAVNTPGTIYKRNPDGTYADAPLIQTDVVTTVLTTGNLTSVDLLGRIELSKLFVRTTSNQDLFVSKTLDSVARPFTPINQLLNATDATTDLFTGPEDSLPEYGISQTDLERVGLTGADFSRLLLTSQADQVFSRIGTEEILRNLWNQSDIPKRLANTSTSSSSNPTLNKVSQQITAFNKDITFYRTRMDRLRRLSVATEQYLATTTIDDTSKQLLTELAGLDSFPSSITGILSYARRYEQAFSVLESGATKDQPEVVAITREAKLLLQEIEVGRELNYPSTSSKSVKTSSKTGSDRCTDTDQIRSLIREKSTTLRTFALRTGGCQLESNLDLPIGSLEELLKLPKDERTAANLEFAIGTVESRTLQTKDPSDSALRALGRRRLEASIFSLLSAQIPQFKTATEKVSLSSNDLYSALSGNSKPLVQKVGSTLLDTKLNWPLGTSYQLIYPVCLDDTGIPGVCDARRSEESRVRTLAIAGLQQLGLNGVQLPPGFSFTAKGNMATNYAGNYLAQQLGLVPNTFTGSYTDVSNRNTSQAMLGFLFGQGREAESPFVRKLLSLQDGLINRFGAVITTQKGLQSASPAVQDATAVNLQLTQAIVDLRGLVLVDVGNAESTFFVGASSALEASAELEAFAEEHATRYTTIVQGLIAKTTTQDVKRIFSVSLPELGKPDALIVPSYNPSAGILFNNILEETYGWYDLLQLRFGLPNGYNPYNKSIAVQEKGAQSLLEQRFSLKPGTLRSFILGTIKAEDFTEKIGTEQIARNFGEEAIKKTVSDPGVALALFAVSELGGLGKAGDYVTDRFRKAAEDTCSNSLKGFGSRTGGQIAPVTGTCSPIISAASRSLPDLLVPKTPEDRDASQAFFSNFAIVAGTQLDDKLNLTPGSMASVITRPSSAGSIFTQFGINEFGKQLFPGESPTWTIDSLATRGVNEIYEEAQRTVKNLGKNIKDDRLRAIYTAGYYDPILKEYAPFTFDRSAAVGEFSRQVDLEVTKQLTTIAKDISGVSVGIGVIEDLRQGNLRGLEYLATARLAKDLNTKLAQSASQGTDAAKYARRRNSLAIDLNDLELSMGIVSNRALRENLQATRETTDTLYWAGVDYDLIEERIRKGTASQADIGIVSAGSKEEYQDLALSQTSSNQRNFREWVLNSTEVKEDEGLREVVLMQSNYERLVVDREVIGREKQRAQKSMQYRAMDMAAFALDPNIPDRFAERMLEGNDGDRARTLFEYYGNTARIGTIIGIQGIEATDLTTLQQIFNTRGQGYNGEAGQVAALGKITKVVDGQLSKIFGKDLALPDGLGQSLAAWGAQGFDGKSFLKSPGDGPFKNIARDRKSVV